MIFSVFARLLVTRLLVGRRCAVGNGYLVEVNELPGQCRDDVSEQLIFRVYLRAPRRCRRRMECWLRDPIQFSRASLLPWIVILSRLSLLSQASPLVGA